MSEQLTLIYESMLLNEDASKRIEYLYNKYYDGLAQAFLEYNAHGHHDAVRSHIVRAYSRSHRDDAQAQELAKQDFIPDNEAYQQIQRKWLFGLISWIVNTIDPTHGKYSEWLVKRLVNLHQDEARYLDSLSEDDREEALEDDMGPLWGWYRVLEDYFLQGNRGEDTYKISEALDAYDRLKHTLPQQQRDINYFYYSSIFTDAVQPLIDHLASKALSSVGVDESIKVLDNYNQWTVIVPLTMKASQKYGMGTKWCTAAREENHNRFKYYNDDGPLIIFINGEDKWQWWSDLTKLDRTEYQFVNAKDHPIKLTQNVIPYKIIEAAIDASPNRKIEDSLLDMSRLHPEHINYEHPPDDDNM